MTIGINSPAGSGNTFLRVLLENLFFNEIRDTVSHTVDTMRTDLKQIYILRNPYDNIASATERHLDSSNDQHMSNKFNIVDKNKVDIEIKDHIRHYRNFINDFKNHENLIPITFEFLTQDTENCAKYIAKKFNIPVKENHLTPSLGKKILFRITNSDSPNRAPRPKSKDRIIIDNMLKEDYDLSVLYGLYLKEKQILQSTENMVQ
jgi:hypothetical protein